MFLNIILSLKNICISYKKIILILKFNNLSLLSFGKKSQFEAQFLFIKNNNINHLCPTLWFIKGILLFNYNFLWQYELFLNLRLCVN